MRLTLPLPITWFSIFVNFDRTDGRKLFALIFVYSKSCGQKFSQPMLFVFLKKRKKEIWHILRLIHLFFFLAGAFNGGGRGMACGPLDGYEPTDHGEPPSLNA